MAGAIYIIRESSLDGALYYYVQTRGVGGTEAYIYNTHLYGDPMTRVLYAHTYQIRIRLELWSLGAYIESHLRYRSARVWPVSDTSYGSRATTHNTHTSSGHKPVSVYI